ncbi:MAG: site-specific integrase [Dehalococcoidia bacterium]|nr:site-specific integrase [Dehalococcoidia bacterium]
MARGHLVKRGKESWSIVLNLGTDQNGQRKQQWVSIKGSKKDAEKKLSEMLHQLDMGTFVRPGKLTLAEFLDHWLRDYAKPNLTAKSYERYESICRVHLVPSLGKTPLTQLRPDAIQKLYASKLADGLAPRSVKYIHTVLHCALESALKWGLLARNPAHSTTPPRATRPDMQTWGGDEIGQFLEAAKKTQYHALFYLALYSGARRSELLSLRWQDVDLLLGQIYISRTLHHLRDGGYVFSEPKSAKSRRTVALPPSAVGVLCQHREQQQHQRQTLGSTLSESDLLFADAQGWPLRPNTVSRAWVNLAVRSGLKAIRFHDARHTHATLLLKAGTHPKIVQERLGHAGIGIQGDTYSGISPGMQQAAAQSFDDALNSGYNGRRESRQMR